MQEISGVKNEISPSDSIELDLGLESLKQMEVVVVLEKEFGVKLPGDVAITHVRDLLKHLPEVAGGMSVEKFSWRNILQQKREPSLEQMFNLKRGCIKNLFVEMVRFSIRIILWLCYRVKIEKLSELDKHDGPVIIAANHQSYLDPMIIYCYLSKKRLHQTAFVAFDAYFRSGILSLLVRPGRIIKTASSKTNISSLQYSAEAIEKGFSVCIFPEGQRASSGKLEKPMLGPGILSCEKQVPIYPLVINGAMNSYSRTTPGFHFTKITLELLDPIYPPKKEEYDENDYQNMVKTWSEKISPKIIS